MVYPPLREAPRDRGLSTAADQLALLNSTLDITKTTTGDTGLRAPARPCSSSAARTARRPR